MIAGGDHRDARPQKIDANFGANPTPTRGILTVGHHKIDPAFLLEPRDGLNDGPTTGFPNNISKKKQPEHTSVLAATHSQWRGDFTRKP